jgi:periplasmic copper chaperone A
VISVHLVLARGPRRLATAAVAALALVATLGLSGCGSATTPIATTSAYIPQPTKPGTTVAYMDIRNNSKTQDQLISATTSVGGRVSLLAPDGIRSGTRVMKVVPALTIPAKSMLRMNPNSYRLQITGAGHMQGGKDVFITLRFAHAGKVSVVALVTDPESGGGSYFLN